MPNYYTYLISSLPMPHFGAKPQFSFNKFLQMCEGIISDEDINILRIISRESGYVYRGSQPTLRKWYEFDRALRNELVKIRASRKHIDPLKYIRHEEYAKPYISRIAMNAYRNPSILEAEMMLDQERWQALEELTTGHYFDIDFLIVYACKLLILEKWERIRTADKEKVLEETLQK